MAFKTYKFHEHRYPHKGNFAFAALQIKEALELMGYTEGVELADRDNIDLHIYNHTCRDLEPDMPENSIIFKPTAPTAQHFSIDWLGYANSSSITFERPYEYEFRSYTKFEMEEISNMISRRANKWDDSILLKWKDAKDIKQDHILIVGQTLNDETVKGFGFGNHFTKLTQIVDKLKDYPLIIKLHPSMSTNSMKRARFFIDKWTSLGHQVFTGYESIHSILPYTKCAIIDNSTAGIECMMHDVPIISYGYPDYHWVTQDLRILTELRGYIDDLDTIHPWFHLEDQRQFMTWYIFDYLCNDIPTTIKRLKDILQ